MRAPPENPIPYNCCAPGMHNPEPPLEKSLKMILALGATPAYCPAMSKNRKLIRFELFEENLC